MKLFHQEELVFSQKQMSQPTGPPPYSEGPQANIHGPPQHYGGYGGPPYMGPPYGGGPPIIIMQQPQQQQQIVQHVVVRSETNHALCCLICFLTGGLSLPCWIWACITD